MPRFLHSKLYHKLELGTNFTAKIPAVLLENLHKKFHVNISFEVIQYGELVFVNILIYNLLKEIIAKAYIKLFNVDLNK